DGCVSQPKEIRSVFDYERDAVGLTNVHACLAMRLPRFVECNQRRVDGIEGDDLILRRCHDPGMRPGGTACLSWRQLPPILDPLVSPAVQIQHRAFLPRPAWPLRSPTLSGTK